MAFLIIVAPGEGARLEALRGQVSFIREFPVCENVLAVAMPPGFDTASALQALLTRLDSRDFALVELSGVPEGSGAFLDAITAANHATIFKSS